MAKLYLVELTPSTDVRSLMSDLADNARANGAELIEAQVTADRSRVFAILEADDPAGVVAATSDLATEACEPAQVRLGGAELADIKAVRPEAGYLVEWDIPASIDMDTYLARKAEKSPLYEQVPEVTFLRTYVREDMAKCLCFYNAPDVDAVVHAREVVSTPIDRLHALDHIEL